MDRPKQNRRRKLELSGMNIHHHSSRSIMRRKSPTSMLQKRRRLMPERRLPDR
jgi:hypothetical protein